MNAVDTSEGAIGGAYERQVGERYERAGFVVEYRGIKRGKRDGGIDLVCVRRDRKVLVQCKCWGAAAEISHVEVLRFWEACVRHKGKHDRDDQERLPGFPAVCYGYAFVTDGRFSRRARRVAEERGVSVREGFLLAVNFSRRGDWPETRREFRAPGGVGARLRKALRRFIGLVD